MCMYDVQSVYMGCEGVYMGCKVYIGYESVGMRV